MKLNATQTHIKVPLACLRITTNVRTDFDEAEIAELAKSIRENGLINAITVKPSVTDENGDKTYEVIAGGRRIRACQWLCDHGDDFSMIDCKISTGDMWTIQMIENIQRADLTPREKENAIARALDEGMSQKEIAEKLSKPQTYISDIVAGMKVRKIADAACLSTDTISTKALAQLRSIPESEIDGYIVQLSERGGTVSVATELLHEWQNSPIRTFREHQEEMQSFLSTLESNEEDEIDIIGSAHFTPGDIINAAGKRLFFDDLKIGMQFVHASDEQSHMFLRVCEVTKINTDTEQAFYTDGDRSCGHGIINKKDIDSDKNEHDSWIYASPVEAHEEKAETAPKPKKKPDGFNWYVRQNDHCAMLSVMGRLPVYLKQMPLDTKICVQAGSKVAEISSVIYEPEENRLIFRCLVDFGIH